MSDSTPRNLGLPHGISLLRQLNAKATPTTLNLGLGKPEEDMPASLRTLALDALRTPSLEYTENAGDLTTRNALAKKLEISNGKQIIFTHGAQEALMAVMMAILNPGDEVLIPDPGFLAYAPMIRMLGAKPILYTLVQEQGAYTHSLSQIENKISANTRMILVSSPGNPTGCDLPQNIAKDLFQLIQGKRIVILSDEVYGMLHFSQSDRPLATQSNQVISVGSFSKSHAMTGWRLGWLATENAELLQSCLIAHQYIATCASVPAQRVIAALLDSPLYESIPQKYKVHYQAKLELFLKECSPALRAATPKACGAFYLFPKTPNQTSSLEFCERLLKEKNLLAIPGVAFGPGGEGSIRLSLALPDEKVKEAAHTLSLFY